MKLSVRAYGNSSAPQIARHSSSLLRLLSLVFCFKLSVPSQIAFGLWQHRLPPKHQPSSSNSFRFAFQQLFASALAW